MGKLSRGFLGGFQGQVGTAYGCFWWGMDLIKAMPRKTNRPPTEGQLPARTKLPLVAAALAQLAPVIDVAYKSGKANRSAMNNAVAYNLENAVTGAYPNFTIDYPALRFSDGSVGKPFNYQLSTAVDAEFHITWGLSATADKYTRPTDKATFVAYNPLKDEYVIAMGAVPRSALEYDLLVPAIWSGNQAHVYMCFIAADDKMASKTQYLGMLEVQ